MFTLSHSLLPIPILLVALWCGSAVAAFSWQPKGTDDQGVVVITEQNNGQTVAVSRKGSLMVRLESQMGTGYGWQTSKTDGRRLKLLGGPELENSSAALPGGVEHQVFRFKALRPGTSVLELAYRRPWDRKAKPAKTFRLKVRAR